MGMTPEMLQNIGEVAGVIIVSSLAAVGGYVARWKMKPMDASDKPERVVPPVRVPTGDPGLGPYPKTCDACSNKEVVIAVSKIPDILESLKVLTGKLDNFLDDIWGVIRAHERKIGRLEGAAGVVDNDTKEVHT